MIDTMLVVVATEMEVVPFLKYMSDNAVRRQPAYRAPGNLAKFFSYYIDEREVDVLITGVGMTATALQVASLLSHRRASGEGNYELAINAGLAGSFTENYPLGTPVEVVSDSFEDFGAENGSGKFLSVFDMGLLEKNQPPFDEEGILQNPNFGFFGEYVGVHGVTVNKALGRKRAIERLKKRFEGREPHLVVETMESAAFFLACRAFNQDFSCVRVISNYVGVRDKRKWDLPFALEELNDIIRYNVFEDFLTHWGMDEDFKGDDGSEFGYGEEDIFLI